MVNVEVPVSYQLSRSGGGPDFGNARMSDFTPRAQQVLALARKEAERFKHNYVGTEHLLLGLIKLGQGVAVDVLQKMGLDLERVRMEVEKHVGSHPATNMIGNIPYTPRVKKVLALAAKEAKALNHSYVGTELQCIGATTLNEYRKYIEKDAALERRFQTVMARQTRCHAQNLARTGANNYAVISHIDIGGLNVSFLLAVGF